MASRNEVTSSGWSEPVWLENIGVAWPPRLLALPEVLVFLGAFGKRGSAEHT
jgi:hypothetical protein